MNTLRAVRVKWDQSWWRGRSYSPDKEHQWEKTLRPEPGICCSRHQNCKHFFLQKAGVLCVWRSAVAAPIPFWVKVHTLKNRTYQTGVFNGSCLSWWKCFLPEKCLNFSCVPCARTDRSFLQTWPEKRLRLPASCVDSPFLHLIRPLWENLNWGRTVIHLIATCACCVACRRNFIWWHLVHPSKNLIQLSEQQEDIIRNEGANTRTKRSQNLLVLIGSRISAFPFANVDQKMSQAASLS